MKQWLTIFLISLVLATSVAAQAVECVMMAAPKTTSMIMESSPCPSHIMSEPQPKNSEFMSVADCFNIDKISAADISLSLEQLVKTTYQPMFNPSLALNTQIYGNVILPRASPDYALTPISSRSLILTTQRFRV